MRKLVALLLVLAAAPLANAGMLTFVCPDAVAGKVQQNTWVTINVVTDTPDTSGFKITIVSDNFNVQTGTLNANFAPATASVGTIKDGSKSGIVIYTAYAANTARPFCNAGDVVYNFKVFSGVAGTSFTVNDYKGTSPYGGPSLKTTINGTEISDTTAGMAALTLNVVPEPATMALLSLGGLFFARRK